MLTTTCDVSRAAQCLADFARVHTQLGLYHLFVLDECIRAIADKSQILCPDVSCGELWVRGVESLATRGVAIAIVDGIVAWRTGFAGSDCRQININK
jgi:hypothetical protein